MNGRAGRGTKNFDRAEAERLVKELNSEYPQIHHEVVAAKPEGATGETSGATTLAFSAA